MRIVIHKYELHAGETVLQLPEAADPVHLAIQHGKLCLWAMLDPLATRVSRRFLVCATGEAIPSSTSYLGTVLESVYVWHVFERVTAWEG